MSSEKLSRRHLMQLVAGGLVAARQGRARAQPNGNLIIFHTPNGFARTHFGAEGSGQTFRLKPSLLPLEPFKHSITVVTGLCNKATDAHTGASQLCRLLTCASGPQATTAYGPSADQRLAVHLGAPALNLGVLAPPSSPWQQQLSWHDSGKPSPTVWNPLDAWQQAFGEATPWQSEAADKELLVLDYLELDSLRSWPLAQLPPHEKARVHVHQEAWANYRRTWASRTANCQDPRLTPQELAALPNSLTTANFAAHGRAKMDLIVAALACQTRRVCTLLWQGAGPGSFNPISGKADHFALSQKQDDATLLERQRIDFWYAMQFAYLLDRLEQQKVLDQTLVVWCSEVAEGQHHNNMTFVLAGGAELRLHQMATFTAPCTGAESNGLATARLPANRSVRDLWLTILKAFECPGTFGDADGSAGIIGELLRS